ncbi:MAG: inositol monophosphatase [Gammaproteobacteria bacterium]|nr:inositol monophosphatase [Gammaproteobacteria bacterium]
MELTNQHLHKLSEQAVIAARAAGAVINAHRDIEVEVHKKQTGSSAAAQVVTQVDRLAQSKILSILKPLCLEYDVALLAEESTDNGQRLLKHAFWSIDPMDGTLNFINKTPGFSVSIALVAKDGTPLLGVVYDPVEDTLYHALQNAGAYKNGVPIQVPALNPNRPLVLRTDFSFQTDKRLKKTLKGLEVIAQKLGLNGAEIEYRNGAVMNACGLLEDPNMCYFKYPKPSGGSLWDYAATACLYHEVGAVASDIYGQSMDLNRADSTFMNHKGLLYAADKTLAQDIIEFYSASIYKVFKS